MRKQTSEICKWFAMAFFAVSFTSCCTMISGTNASISIVGNVDEPVTIVSSFAEYRDVTLPTVVEVKRRHLNGQRIEISSENHTFDDIVLEKKLNEWVLADFVTSIPLIVDLCTNAVSKPKYNSFFITPREKMDSLQESTYQPIPISPHKDNTQPNTIQSDDFKRHEINCTAGFGRNQADYYRDRFLDNIIQRHHFVQEGGCGDVLGESYIVGKLEYHYRLNRKWDLGAMMAWGLSSENYDHYDYYYEHKKENSDIVRNDGYERCTFFTFGPSVRYSWYETNKFRFYSRVVVGAMHHHLSFELKQWESYDRNAPINTVINKDYWAETQWRMAYQISPIGFSVGFHNLKFNTEIGYGCLGVVNMGISVCF